jgi:hypothetical protein
MTNHVVLIFAYHFPPENAIGGARPFRFAKYLSRLGYTCRVFTAAEQDGRSDPNTEYVPDPFVASTRQSFSWQLERAIRKVFLPGDVGMYWSYRAARAARAYIRAHPGARVTIFSTFPPLGSHLAGWQLARGNRMVWIADCRDPLTGESADGHRAASQRRLYRRLERLVARRADAVIANTDAALNGWKERFPSSSNKLHLIWNGFDPEERLTALPASSHDCKTLSHVGTLYHGRSATPILESVARLIAANRLAAGSVRVRLVGPAEAGCLPGPEFIQGAKSQGWLDLVTEQIPSQQAQQVAQSSSHLLLLQWRSTDQVPGKSFEYLQIGRPILAFIQPNSPTQRLLDQSGVPHRCVYPGASPEEIDNTVAEFLEVPSTPVGASPWFDEQFNAEHQTQMLDEIIRSLHCRRPGWELQHSVPYSRATARRRLQMGNRATKPEERHQPHR